LSTIDAQDHAVNAGRDHDAGPERESRLEHLPDLRRCLEEDRGQVIVLDLGEVTLVDVDVVRFLVECQTRAIRVAQCPGYVREWMVREKPPSE
jgi:hypothetical protein